MRALAAELNERVVQSGVSVETLLRANFDLQPRDSSLLRALLSGSLRWHHRLEWQLGKLLKRPLKRRDTRLAALMRLGLLQLQALRIPDHAAVSATVETANELGLGRARGLVNAVLRRYLREREQLEVEMARLNEPRFSHPLWLIELIEQDWPDQWREILEANNVQAPMWLRVNRAHCAREQYAERLAADGKEASLPNATPDGLLLAEPCRAQTLPGFSDGLVSVQDGAAQLAAPLMDLQPGLRVLDACAAPGGKTAHMLELCPSLGKLVALDRDRERLDRVAENLSRLKLEAELVHADAIDTGDWWDRLPFDRILLDAPCSATGVIRRHPDIKLLRQPADLAAQVAVQAELLRTLWGLLAPGGLLVYATCSIARAENVAQIERFLGATPTASLPEYGTARHFQRLPGDANMDGFYYACLRKSLGT